MKLYGLYCYKKSFVKALDKSENRVNIYVESKKIFIPMAATNGGLFSCPVAPLSRGGVYAPVLSPAGACS